MKKEWVLTQDTFDTLLNWLDPNPDRAGMKYENIRLRLIKIFTCRQCWAAEELADETINRVVARVTDVVKDYEGDPALYFYGVARNVEREYRRKLHLQDSDASADDAARPTVSAGTVWVDDAEPEYECLERCLDSLPTNNRKMVLEYYQQERQAKIDHHKRLADELGIAVNALRIRVHRIRRALGECVRDCLEQQPAH